MTAIQDVRYALRTLVKSPGFTAAAVLSLALGIGANTAIFTLINAVFLHPLPVEEPSRVIELFTVDHLTSSTGNLGRTPMSLPNYEDFRDQNQSFTGLATFTFGTATLSGHGEPKQQNLFLASANYFDVLGVKPYRGRMFLPEEDRKPTPVAVLSYAAWQTIFGGDPGTLGRTLDLNSTSYTIVGIAPQGFKGTFTAANPDVIWIPVSMYRELPFSALVQNRRFRAFNVFGRLKPRVGEQQALANLTTIATQLEREYPKDNRGRTVEISSLAEASLPFRGRNQGIQVSTTLTGVVGFVLLIACANLANLMLARSTKRAREMGIRTALGAGRLRLVRQLLTESFLLALAGGAAGLLLGTLGSELLWSFRPAGFGANNLSLQLDSHVFGFAVAVTLLTALLFGLAPAIQGSVPDLSSILKSGGRGTTGSGQNRLRGLLVSSEIALALVALIGAGLFLRSMRHAESMNAGFETERLCMMNFDLASRHYTPEHGREFLRAALEHAQGTPGVRSVALASAPPLGQGPGVLGTTYREQEDPANAAGVLVLLNYVSPSYFDTLRIPLRRGRALTPFDRDGSQRVAVISASLAERFWPGQDPIGRRFQFQDRHQEVVGVVEDISAVALGLANQPIAYLPLEQNYQSAMSIVARTDGNPAVALKPLQASVQALDTNLALTNPSTMPALILQGLWAPRTGAALFSIFGFLGMLLAGVGIYGVMAYMVALRTNEIGIRMALGARPADVLRLVVGQGARLALAGIVLGLAVALALSRVMAGLLFRSVGSGPTHLRSRQRHARGSRFTRGLAARSSRRAHRSGARTAPRMRHRP